MVIAKAGCFNLFCPRLHKQTKELLEKTTDGMTGRRALNDIELAEGTLPRDSGRCRGQTGQ